MMDLNFALVIACALIASAFILRRTPMTTANAAYQGIDDRLDALATAVAAKLSAAAAALPALQAENDQLRIDAAAQVDATVATVAELQGKLDRIEALINPVVVATDTQAA
jgi:hypothetical protein